ncbi:MAG: UvrD-helicase domain-containing protein, partial [Pirellulales bacterium]
AERVRERMRSSPSYDDLLVRAWEEVTVQPSDTAATADGKRSFRAVLQGKFKLAIVDEAQDTNRLQWEFLHAIFPGDGDRPLVAVGDPKQAIYRFRGADVAAYITHAQDGVPAEANGEPPRRTLFVNRRSDGPLLDGLNVVMQGVGFGPGIEYHKVDPAPGRETSRLEGLRPVEFLNTGAMSLVAAAVAKVHEMITGSHFRPVDGSPSRPFRPGEVCVLVRSNPKGAAIAKRLGDLRIPAVTTGTASVMTGEMAADLRVLLDAMERPSDAGRSRRVATTAFFGVPLESVAALGEEKEQQVQETVAQFHAVLQKKGMAALATAIMNNEEIATRIAQGQGGERRIVDFSHVAEVLHEAAGGKGCHARVMLEHFSALAAKDDTSELVSRRVESDADAVRIMTVHAAKGLQFPCVIVVDAWTKKPSAGRPAVFHAEGERRLDVGDAVQNVGASDTAKKAALAAENDEMKRLIYVAVTRAQHHVCVVRGDAWRTQLLGAVMPHAPDGPAAVAMEHVAMMAVRTVADLPATRPWALADVAHGKAIIGPAPLPPPVIQTYRRTSYSGITAWAARATNDPHAAVARGHDEEVATAATATDEATLETAVPVELASAPAAPDPARFTIADLPAGTAFGSVVHEIFERIEAGPDVEPAALADSVSRVVHEVATSAYLEPHRREIASLITAALETPFGGPADAAYRELRFADFSACDRLTELNFEMALPPLASGVKARHVGRVLRGFLDDKHPLAGYAEQLSGREFDVPLAGLINGSIDAVLRLPGRPADDPRLVIADYKTNRLHDRDDAVPLAAYAPARLFAAMAAHHYPLQALVYGTALWRMLRWRLGRSKPAGWDPGECLAGIVYAYVRGMQGAETPVDAAGHRYGVFSWQPPPGIWKRLSDLLAGDLTGVR